MTQALLGNANAATHEDDVAQFLRDIRQYPRLTEEQELELAKRCAMGDQDAVRTMVNCNLRLVVSVAREYTGRGVPLVDLIQEGAIGLLSAAKNFDHTKKCRFSTYATKWIRQGVDRCVLKHAGVIRVPLHTMEKMRKIMAVKESFQQREGYAPSAEEIAENCDLPADKVTQLLELMPRVGSLDTPVGENEDDNLQALIANIQAPHPYEELVRRELRNTLDSLLDMLTDRQRLILRLHFGMEDGKCHTLQGIADMLGISKERTRQVEHQALAKLQALGANLGLEEFLE